MMQKIQRFGGAMFTPVLLFAFSGIMVGFSILFKNPEIMGSLARESGLWYQIWNIIEQGAWTVFNQLPLLFVIGLPIGLAKKQQARACMESLVIYLTFNYFLGAILSTWGPTFGVDFATKIGGASGLTTIAGIKTLDTGMIGAILISGIVVWIHDKYFDVELPEFLGTFRGSAFVAMIGFFAMIPLAVVMAFVWPKVQGVIAALQGILVGSGVIGVWVYTFLERILIPTGLHHFIYTPFIFDSVVVEGGINSYWALHLSQFSSSTEPLKTLFPEGGFALHGMSKVFGSLGIAAAFYVTAKPNKKKIVLGLLIPATLTAVVAGITEPLEFTFLFIAPVLFLVHALLAATLSSIAFSFGVVGNFGGGLIDWIALNWIPLFSNYTTTYITQIIIGLIFTGIYFVVFRYLILKFKFKTPGREDEDEETKLYSKSDYKLKKIEKSLTEDKLVDTGKILLSKAEMIVKALGGKENISQLNNCATRLRISVVDENLVQDISVFKKAGAHGLVKKGKAVQVIIGLSVVKVAEEVELLMGNNLSI
ncbi:alpha-glucoside-specific PTS transporter subunit IIBC [Clostridium gasigenes]|uniref:alpha-glucoside-specific PTS transporter subunit IIBC n=1 Tax=Clostridium gasigenes TaxID=94869 RepID=UPI001C0D4AA9|nr:alpha-glucoside-specific PTS transporter subunit IIBC [Clostridium gasigenes]MBU3088694.1 alpha-glucoside-specific PTS transporter subunit IIBC [Clostridium gasigenes]